MSLPPHLEQWRHEVFACAKACDIEPVLIFAHMEVETVGGTSKQLDRPGPGGRGDHGHGLGLMQIDDRANPDFAVKKMADGSPAWADPMENILYGARVIASNLRIFDGDVIPAAAAYNAGAGRVRHALRDLTQPGTGAPSREARLHACDSVTMHCDYVTRVLAQIARLNPLLLESE